MAIRPFLAMTAAEIRNCTPLPPKIAWMACHFSPYGRGLSNLPNELPENSLLVVDDITPIHRHDPEVITRQLLECSERLFFHGVLLDFQRPGKKETAELAAYLSKALPCPVAVSEHYAADCSSPVFLSPLPPSVALRDYLKSWQEREVWLDLSCWGEVLRLAEDGCTSTPLSPGELPDRGFEEQTLHCHYQITEKDNAVEFTLWRTQKDLSALLEEAEEFGVTTAVGLYQEFSLFPL